MLRWVLDPPSRKRRPRQGHLGRGVGIKELPDKPQVWCDPCPGIWVQLLSI